MKNMVYCLICNLLLVALVILTSCERQSDTVAESFPSFTPAVGGMLTEKDMFCQDNFREDAKFSFQPRKVRYVKVADDFLLCRQPANPYGERKNIIQFSGLSGKDPSKGRPSMTDKSQKDLIRWAVAGGM